MTSTLARPRIPSCDRLLETNKPTLSEVFDDYIRVRKPARNTFRTYKSWFNHHLLQFADRTLDSIDSSEIEFYFGVSSATSPTAANQAFRVLGYLCTFAKAYYKGYRELDNPCRFLSICKAWNRSVPGHSSIEDLRTWNVARVSHLAPIEQRFLLLLLLTGLRFSELGAVSPCDIEVSPTGAVVLNVFLKQQRWHKMPLGEYAGTLLSTLVSETPPEGSHTPLFAFGESPVYSGATFYRKMWGDCEKFSFHSLRRTWNAVGLEAGIPEIDLKLLIGHSAGANMTQHYATGQVEAVRGSMQKIENFLLTKMGIES